jgi:Dyp-type peroxidase family
MATTSTSAAPINWEDVQGLVLHGYGGHRYTGNLLLQIDDAPVARGWLTALMPLVTTATKFAARPEECYFNLAFTRTGLEKLGLSDKVLASFPTAFFEGTASDNRSRILGDTGDSAPQQWLWGGPGAPVDAVLLIFANDPAVLEAAVQEQQSALKGVSLRVPLISTQVSVDQTEHFGFHDGISQPVIEGSPPLTRPRSSAPTPVYGDSNLIKPGEFLLGYMNEYGVLPDAPYLPAGSDPKGLLPTLNSGDGPALPDLGRNGSFLVVRQVAQHVAQLWRHLDEVTHDPVESDKLAAKLIGRWKSGAPVVLAPDADDPTLSESNDFVYQAKEPGYMHDPDGLRCPFGAHVRRSNPRDTLGEDRVEALTLTKRHRLIRRGRSYGSRMTNPRDLNDAEERGLLFMCVNANIERQFEFVQQTWVNSPSFNGLYSERDPIFGDTSGQKDGYMTIPRAPVRQRLSNLGGFVTIRGGAYFFLPSIKALSYLGSLRDMVLTPQ